MAYEKQTWTTGEVITAEKLNHMEDGIGDVGYDCNGNITDLFEETINAVEVYEGVYQAHLAYSSELSANTLIVTFDGVEYRVAKSAAPYGGVMYGDLQDGTPAPSFERYPFNIQYSYKGGYDISTKTVGEHSVKAQSVEPTIDECFSNVVRQLIFENIVVVNHREGDFPNIYIKVNNAANEGKAIFGVEAGRLTIFHISGWQDDGQTIIFENMLVKPPNTMEVKTYAVHSTGNIMSAFYTYTLTSQS